MLYSLIENGASAPRSDGHQYSFVVFSSDTFIQTCFSSIISIKSGSIEWYRTNVSFHARLFRMLRVRVCVSAREKTYLQFMFGARQSKICLPMTPHLKSNSRGFRRDLDFFSPRNLTLFSKNNDRYQRIDSSRANKKKSNPFSACLFRRSIRWKELIFSHKPPPTRNEHFECESITEGSFRSQ